MSTIEFNTVRYYTNEDPYHYTVDNRPLQDLASNDAILATAVEALQSTTQVTTANYTALRAFTGTTPNVYNAGVTSSQPDGTAGWFSLNSNDTSSADNGGTIIVDTSGRRWYRQFSGPIRGEWFGIAPGNSATVNTQGMMALNAWMISDKSRHYEITLAPGLIQFTNAKWLQNVSTVTVYGGPTQLQNVGTSSSSTENIPIWLNDIFLNNAGTPPGYGTEVNGYLIQTTAKYSTSVNFVNAGDSSNFTAGTWCLVYGYNQGSSGYPPSMRYFEYRRIESVSSGVLTFYEPLNNGYLSTWVDLASDSNALFGAARVLPLDRNGFTMHEYVELNDLELLPSTGYPGGNVASSLGGSLYSGSCIEFRANRVKVNGYYYPTMGKLNYLKNCWIRYTEIDKVLDEVVFEDCEIQQLDNGPATNTIKLLGGRIMSPIANLNCKIFISEDTEYFANTTSLSQVISCAASIAQSSVRLIRPIFNLIDPREVIAQAPAQTGMSTTQLQMASTSSTATNYYNGMTVAILSGTGQYQTRQITAYNGTTQVATINNAWSTQPDNTSVYRVDYILPLVAASTTVSVTALTVSTPNLITVAYTGLGDPTLRGLMVGSWLQSTTTNTKIRVSSIYYNGTNTTIQGEWFGGTPGVSEIFTANLVQQIVIDEPFIRHSRDIYVNNTFGASVDFVASGSTAPAVDDLCVRTQYRNRNRITIPFVFFRNMTGGSSMRINVNGVVTGIQVYVSTAYTGAQSTATMIMTRPSAEGTSPYSQTINLKTSGARTMNMAQTSTALSGDTLQVTPPTFHKQINLQTNNDLSDAPPQGYIVIDLG